MGASLWLTSLFSLFVIVFLLFVPFLRAFRPADATSYNCSEQEPFPIFHEHEKMASDNWFNSWMLFSKKIVQKSVFFFNRIWSFALLNWWIVEFTCLPCLEVPSAIKTINNLVSLSTEYMQPTHHIGLIYFQPLPCLVVEGWCCTMYMHVSWLGGLGS